MRDRPTTAHLLIDKIESEGPISLGEYMAIANADYYGSRDPIGVDGDFITAPEISQMFGELVGVWLADLWMRAGKPRPFCYVELGPGRGTLARDALRAMRGFGGDPEVHFVETSPVLKEKQQAIHLEAQWHRDIGSLPDDVPLLIVANEFFDALPVEQFVRTATGWRRHMVIRERNKFAVIAGGDPVDRLTSAGQKQLPRGTILETSPATRDLFENLANRLAKQGGAMLLVDYGYDQPGTGSTLQAVKNHLPVNPFDDPGNCDLTAHVNFHELANIARTRLLNVAGPVEQGQWLKAIGIDPRSEALIKSAPERAEEIRAARDRLTHIDEMGRLFRVMAMTPLDWPEPEGFSY